MLLQVAMIGYDREPEFEPMAPGQWPYNERIAHALRNVPVFIKAVQDEKQKGKENRARL